MDHGGVLLESRRAKFDNGWLHTGDVGRIDPLGYVTLTDRAKDVIKSGGEWISSVELENHLMGHPAISAAAVVAVPDERWQERPLAVVVVNQGAEVCAKGITGVPRRQGRSLVAAGAMGLHRGGAADQRRQVRQEDDPSPLRRGRLRRHRPARLTFSSRADANSHICVDFMRVHVCSASNLRARPALGELLILSARRHGRTAYVGDDDRDYRPTKFLQLRKPLLVSDAFPADPNATRCFRTLLPPAGPATRSRHAIGRIALIGISY